MKRIWGLFTFIIIMMVFASGNVQASSRVSDEDYIAVGQSSFEKKKPKLKATYGKWKEESDNYHTRKVRIGWNKISGASKYEVWIWVDGHSYDGTITYWKYSTHSKNSKRYFTLEQYDADGTKEPFGQEVYFKIRGVRTVKGKKQYTRWSNVVRLIYDYDI